MVDLEFDPAARAEYREVVAWYQARSPGASARFEAEVQRLMGVIAAYPMMFPNLNNVNRFAKLHHFPYSLIYAIEPDHIMIIAVSHASRKPGYWLDRP